MKYLHIAFVILSFCLNTMGQWNIQSGYDFGLIKFPSANNLDREIHFNNLHRANLIIESILDNGLLFSAKSGFDYYNTKANFSRTERSNNTRVTNFLYDSNVKNIRLELGIGYSLNLDDKNAIIWKAHTGIFHVLDKKTIKSEVSSESYSGEVIKDENLLAFKSEYVDLVNIRDIYGSNRYGFHPVSLTIEYRYFFGDYFLNSLIGYSPMRRGFTINNGSFSSFNHIFMIGVQIGYNL